MRFTIIFLIFYFTIVIGRIVPQRENRHMNVASKPKPNVLNLSKQIFPKNFTENRNESVEYNGMKHTYNLNGSIHYKINTDQGKVASSVVERFENDFRKLIAMDGLKYIFKRGPYWRTWRKVKYSNGEDKIVFYKCSNPVALNSSDCQSVGLWNIDEESPPCPYELFSMVNDYKFCGASYTHFTGDLNETCPATIKLFDLKPSCTNPIVTNWQITPTRTRTPDKKPLNIICGDKKFCVITTVYTIMHTQVVFRIINSTSDIIYSKIMRPHSNNYICIENCGRYNVSLLETTTENNTKINKYRPVMNYNSTYYKKIQPKTLRPPTRLNPPLPGNLRVPNKAILLKKIDHVKKLQEEYMRLYAPVTATPDTMEDDTFSYEDYHGYG